MSENKFNVDENIPMMYTIELDGLKFPFYSHLKGLKLMQKIKQNENMKIISVESVKEFETRIKNE